MQTYKVTTDADLVRLGAAAMSTQKKLAAVAGCSERLLSEVRNGKRNLPTTPVPGVNRTPAQLIQAAIDLGGKVPEVHRAAGRPPRIDTRGVILKVPSKVAARFRAEGVDLSAAILAFVATRPVTPGDATTFADFTPWPASRAPLVSLSSHLTPEASVAMATHLAGDVTLREAFLRAVVRNALPQSLVKTRAAA